MRPAFRPLLVVFGVLVVLAGFSVYRGRRLAHDNIPWRKDLQAAKAEAASSGKPVLAYFTATWCGPCQRMHEETWPDPRVGAALQAYVPVKIDVDQNSDLAMSFNVDGIPRMQVIGADGTRGRSREGFATAEELAKWLKGSE
jgi:thiol:disulfide interchange protein